ncbi:hypothetical protein BGZ60DRAFT_426751 [Tricladium varicosporioides]|nr:hypothetical protein BGZ60DRAFT_426751 [Hymenoscyphus varicosporioides]
MSSEDGKRSQEGKSVGSVGAMNTIQIGNSSSEHKASGGNMLSDKLPDFSAAKTNVPLNGEGDTDDHGQYPAQGCSSNEGKAVIEETKQNNAKTSEGSRNKIPRLPPIKGSSRWFYSLPFSKKGTGATEHHMGMERGEEDALKVLEVEYDKLADHSAELDRRNTDLKQENDRLRNERNACKKNINQLRKDHKIEVDGYKDTIKKLQLCIDQERAKNKDERIRIDRERDENADERNQFVRDYENALKEFRSKEILLQEEKSKLVIQLIGMIGHEDFASHDQMRGLAASFYSASETFCPSFFLYPNIKHREKITRNESIFRLVINYGTEMFYYVAQAIVFAVIQECIQQCFLVGLVSAGVDNIADGAVIDEGLRDLETMCDRGPSWVKLRSEISRFLLLRLLQIESQDLADSTHDAKLRESLVRNSPLLENAVQKIIDEVQQKLRDKLLGTNNGVDQDCRKALEKMVISAVILHLNIKVSRKEYRFWTPEENHDFLDEYMEQVGSHGGAEGKTRHTDKVLLSVTAALVEYDLEKFTNGACVIRAKVVIKPAKETSLDLQTEEEAQEIDEEVTENLQDISKNSRVPVMAPSSQEDITPQPNRVVKA